MSVTEAVLALHHSTTFPASEVAQWPVGAKMCAHCVVPYPCETARVVKRATMMDTPDERGNND